MPLEINHLYSVCFLVPKLAFQRNRLTPDNKAMCLLWDPTCLHSNHVFLGSVHDYYTSHPISQHTVLQVKILWP